MTESIEVNGRWWRPSLTASGKASITDQPRRFFRWLLRKPLVEDKTYTVTVWTDAKAVGLQLHFFGAQVTEEAPTIFTRHKTPQGGEFVMAQKAHPSTPYIPTSGGKS